MILGKYNQSKTITFDLYDLDGVDMSVAATFAAGDVKIMKDEGAEANTTNLPTDEGSSYSLVLTATEMSAARIRIILIDQTATKVWLDTSIGIETYGNASAEHAFDLDTASTAQTGDSYARIGAPAGASIAADLVVIDNFVDDLETRLTATRAGYLDNLSVAPATATALSTAQADLDTITGADGVTLATSQGAITWDAQVYSVTGATANITFNGSGSGAVFAYTRGGTSTLYDAAYSTALQSEANAACDTALTDYDAATGTELAAVDTKIDTIDTNVDAILVDTNELQTDWVDGGRLDNLLDGASSAGDPWTTAIPGAYGVGTAGYIVGNNVDAPISTVDTVVDGIQTDLDNATDGLGAIKTAVDSRMAEASINTTGGAVDNVTLVGTTTTNTDMRGTDSAATATALATVDTNVDAILVDTGTTLPATLAALNDISVSDILTTQMTEAYAADGVAPTLAQALFLIQQTIGDFSITSTTLTTKQLDGTTTAATYTLDDATNPTSRTRFS